MKLVSSMLVLLAGLFSACSPRQQADYFTQVSDLDFEVEFIV